MRLKKKQGEGVAGSGSEGKRSRSGRGWGPFSGAQLTIIIVTISVMILLPVGAFAVVSGSNVFITDAVSGKQAKVSTNGEVLTNTRATQLISTGTMTVDPATSVNLFTNVPTSAYHGVRLYIGESGASTSSQSVSINSSFVPYVLDNFVMNTANISRFYELPGANLSLNVSNNTLDPATYTWRLYGRTN
jgi:hypothetical protein